MAKLNRLVGNNPPKQVAETKLEAVTPDIGSTVLHYSEAKKKEKELKEEINKDKAVIVGYLHDQNVDKFEHEGVTVTLSVSEKISFNMDALVPHIKKLMKTKDAVLVKGLVKRTEYVDETILEDLIYRGVLDEEEVRELANYQIVNTTETLRVKHAK